MIYYLHIYIYILMYTQKYLWFVMRIVICGKLLCVFDAHWVKIKESMEPEH